MKKTILLFLLFIYTETYGQGFEWQYSFRLPYSIPTKFIGFNGGCSINSVSGDFGFMEDYTPCCNYLNGNGNSINIGIAYEYWISPLGAININLSYHYTNTLFNQTIQIPRSDGVNDYIVKYRYEMDESRNAINLGAYYKNRILQSHWSVLAGVNFTFNLGNNAVHSEQIVSPENEKFIDGTRKRIIKKGIYGDYNLLGLNPIIGINYDIPIFIGYYTSLSSILQIPITSVIKNEDWREWKFQVSVSLLKSID